MENEDGCRQAQRPKYDCLLFDLDETLYSLSSGLGLAAQCRKNIGNYLVEKLGIEESKIFDLCSLLYNHYGTIMAGLRAIGYTLDHDEYYNFVDGNLPYDELKPDPVLRHLLLSLQIRKVIFTNSNKIHAAKVLSRLGLEDCFEGIISFETLNPPEDSSSTPDEPANIFDILDHFSRPDDGVELPKTPILCKPSEFAMMQALKIAKINPQRTIFFDDSVRNIQAGKGIGLHTVLVGSPHGVKDADHALESIHNMREVLPELWEDAEKSEELLYSGKVGIDKIMTGRK